MHNIWSVDLVDMQLMSKFNNEFFFYFIIIFLIPFLLIFSVNMHKLFLKDKKSITITNAFQNFQMNLIADQIKIWVDKGSKCYNKSMKSWLQDNNIEMYSTHNEGKSVAAIFTTYQNHKEENL